MEEACFVLWLSRRTDELSNVFSDNGRIKEQQGNEKLQSELYQQIGKLKVELDWLKKKVGLLS